MGNPKKKVEIPERDVRLPAAENMFESTTIYFGKNPAVSIVCDSRAEAELLAAIAETGYRGPISIPTTEEGCRNLYQRLQDRLTRARAQFEQLARERAGSERLQAQIVEILWGWFIHGFPQNLRKTPTNAAYEQQADQVIE
ncbi:hypothetical protein SBA2_810014 [Acidobacteriia bacterium SbA2]|nr:hypothetical protein SBA2_810014 [Acidobacteriia bacterium SbA2]